MVRSLHSAPDVRTTLTSWILAVAAVAAGCTDPSEPEPTPETETDTKPPDTGKPDLRTKLAAQRALFVEPTSYSFTVETSCFCAPTGGPIRITVADGVVTRAVYRNSNQPVSEEIRGRLTGIPGVFDEIEALLRDSSGWRSEELTFAYDPVLHYPTRVDQSSREIADLGADQRISDFVTPADAP